MIGGGGDDDDENWRLDCFGKIESFKVVPETSVFVSNDELVEILVIVEVWWCNFVRVVRLFLFLCCAFVIGTWFDDFCAFADALERCFGCERSIVKANYWGLLDLLKNKNKHKRM